MTIGEIINALGIDSSDNRTFNSIKIDTRKLEKNDIFIAIKGKNYDGNDFLDEALSKGAIMCISEVEHEDSIKVENTIDSLFRIGKYIKNKYNIPLIAITGSSGKTTTKEMLYHILSSKYKVLKNEGNNNNIFGVTETLFKLNDSYNMIVMELGSNKIGEISYLSKLCNPDLSIITNIGTSHLEYFKNRKEIFKEKYSIIDGMSIPRLIVNGDSKYLRDLKKYKCGLRLYNDLFAYNISLYDDYLTFNIFLDKEYLVRLNTPCKHFINDALLAIKVSLDYGIDINTIIDELNSFNMLEKRFKIEKIKDITIINDCYNSSYESVIGGINYLKRLKGKKLLILGDILELGKYSKLIHKKINLRLKLLRNKDIITIGKYSKYIKGKHYDSSKEVNNIDISNYDYIYIKGSRRVNLDRIYEYIRNIYN